MTAPQVSPDRDRARVPDAREDTLVTVAGAPIGFGSM
jgi:hypothetical protein